MPEHSLNLERSDRPAEAPVKGLGAAAIARGVARLFRAMGYRTLVEFPLANGRRADIVGLDRRGGFVVVEVKSSLADFRADSKWPDYLGFYDAFYFAGDPAFPLAVLPEGVGVIVADSYEGAVVRAAPLTPMSAARRKALTLRFAHTAAARLAGLTDPGFAGVERSR